MDNNYEALHVLPETNPSTMFLWCCLLWMPTLTMSYLCAYPGYSVPAGAAPTVGALADSRATESSVTTIDFT